MAQKAKVARTIRRRRPAGKRRQRSRTALGKTLRELRERLIASGTPLLSLDEIACEVAERRGSRCG